jgi:hypothetical protein
MAQCMCVCWPASRIRVARRAGPAPGAGPALAGQAFSGAAMIVLGVLLLAEHLFT